MVFYQEPISTILNFDKSLSLKFFRGLWGDIIQLTLDKFEFKHPVISRFYIYIISSNILYKNALKRIVTRKTKALCTNGKTTTRNRKRLLTKCK